MKKIAITGNVAVGKSTVGDLLREMGEVVIDVDEIGGEIVGSGELNERLVAEFGAEVMSFGTNKIDRKMLLKKAFVSENARWKLNNLVWPRVKTRLEEIFTQYVEQKLERVFVIIPRLFETNWVGEYGEIWLVESGEELRRKRKKERGYREAELELRWRVPFEIDETAQVEKVRNDGTITQLIEKIRTLI